MRKSLRFLLALVVVVCLVQGGLARVQVPFDADGALSIITELSSGAYEGRMCGTKGNDLALVYVAKRFADGRLTPLPGLKSFRQEFETYVPRLRSTPILQVLDRSHKVVRTYVHRVDFREITAGLTGSGDVRGGFRTAATVGEIGAGRGGLFLLTNEAYQVEDDYALRSSGLKALIIQNPDHIVRRKSLSLLGMPRDGRGGFVKVFVAPRVMKELIAYGKRGCQIRVKVDFSVDRVRTANIVGLLEGTAPRATRRILVLSAHLDHVGRDPSGQVFPGALDNASGTAVMLALLQSLAKLGVRPGWTIVFAALNAEECTMGGSDHLASNWPFAENAAEVLNLDMLGSREVGVISCLTASAEVGAEEKAMIDRLRALAGGLKIPFITEANPSSDHASFAGVGIPAVTLNNAADCHTVRDTAAGIDRARLAAAGALAAAYVAERAY